jgi:hypothetical protein
MFAQRIKIPVTVDWLDLSVDAKSPDHHINRFPYHHSISS